MKYRLLHVPEERKVLCITVPDAHKHTKRVKAGLHRYALFDDVETAAAVARRMLADADERSKRFYEAGNIDVYKRLLMKADLWRPHSDASVGRRILARENHTTESEPCQS